MFLVQLHYIYEFFWCRSQSFQYRPVCISFIVLARIYGQLTGPESPHPDCTEGAMYTPPPWNTKRLRPAAKFDIHRFEGREQILTGECAVKVFPAIGVKGLSRGIIVYDGDIVHARKRGETSERFFPKLNVGLVGLRPNGQRFQRPLLW